MKIKNPEAKEKLIQRLHRIEGQIWGFEILPADIALIPAAKPEV